jgi:hypothetical protein
MVSGVGQNKRQKGLAAALNKTLAGYRQAEEYAHFGTELSPDAQMDYDKGKALFQLMNQEIGEGYSLMDQQFTLDIVLNAKAGEKIDIKKMKELVKEYSPKVVDEKDNSNFDTLRDDLKSKVLISAASAPAAANPNAAAATAVGVDTKPADGAPANAEARDAKGAPEVKGDKDKDHDKKDDKKEKEDKK